MIDRDENLCSANANVQVFHEIERVRMRDSALSLVRENKVGPNFFSNLRPQDHSLELTHYIHLHQKHVAKAAKAKASV